MNLIDKVRVLIGLNPKEQTAETILNSSTGISARSAYMRSKYGVDKTQVELLRAFFSNVNNLIASKTIDGSYCCMVEIDKDLEQFTDKIIEHFSTKLGYEVALISKDSTIQNAVATNGGTSEFSFSKIRSAFMILMWGNPVLDDGTGSPKSHIDYADNEF